MRGDILSSSGRPDLIYPGLAKPVETPSGDFYKFFIGLDQDLYYTKSTNNMLSWGYPVKIVTGTVVGSAVWYDRWTPGDSGNLIHIAFIDATTHDITYDSLDTSSDTLSGNVQVFNGASLAGSTNSCITISKMRGGKLRIIFDGDAGTETGHYDSTDGVTWNSKADPNEGVSDYYMMFPDNAADNQDGILVFWDRSANEISVKPYDDSGDSFSETSVATSMVDLTTGSGSPQFSGAVRLSDSKLILVAWENADTSTAKLRCWEINTAASITEKTNVITSSGGNQKHCAVSIDSNDDLYVYYLGATDGSETVVLAINTGSSLCFCYYKRSTDGGATWGSETKISEVTRNLSYLASSNNLYGRPCVEYGECHNSNVVMNYYCPSIFVRQIALNGGFN